MRLATMCSGEGTRIVDEISATSGEASMPDSEVQIVRYTATRGAGGHSGGLVLKQLKHPSVVYTANLTLTSLYE